MSRKTFLTSGLILGLAISPAIADETEPLYNANNSIESGSCNVTFLGSADGTAANSFEAVWQAIQVEVDAGKYLAQNTVSGTTCPAGSWCSGGTYTFSETTDSGIESCPAGFTLSVAGTTNENDCYHECTASDIENSSKVASIKGGTVTKGGTNTCNAECTTGYTFKAASGGTNPLSGKESIATGGEPAGYSRLDGSAGSKETDYGLTPGSGEWAVEFSHGTIKGEALCSTQSGTGAWDGASSASDVSTADSLTPETGTGLNCWCKITGYTPSGSSTLQSLSSPWVFLNDYRDADFCARDCANYCANVVRSTDSNVLVFRSALFGSVGASSPAACVANEITVTWDQNNGQADITNTCTYDGDITLPTAPEKTGYTFSGWKLVEGSSN